MFIIHWENSDLFLMVEFCAASQNDSWQIFTYVRDDIKDQYVPLNGQSTNIHNINHYLQLNWSSIQDASEYTS